MSVYLDLRNGHSACDLSRITAAIKGPVLGPFLSVRLCGDEVRVVTTCNEFTLTRVGEGLFYGSAFYAEAEVIGDDQIGSRHEGRLTVFDPFLSDLTIEDFG